MEHLPGLQTKYFMVKVDHFFLIFRIQDNMIHCDTHRFILLEFYSFTVIWDVLYGYGMGAG